MLKFFQTKKYFSFLLLIVVFFLILTVAVRADDDEEDDEEEKSSPAQTYTTTSTRVITLPDSDGDGILDKNDPHPKMAEIYIVEDANSNGIVDKFEQ